MADTRYTSPDPTTHDTVGASTIATPLFMPSSPPPPPEERLVDSLPRADSPVSDRVAAEIDGARSPALSRASSPDHQANELDARLAEYTVDFRALSGTQLARDDDTLPDLKFPHEEDKLSEVGGPEDFTANMERYLMDMDYDSEDKDWEEDQSALLKDNPQPAIALGDKHEGQEEEKEADHQPQQQGHGLQQPGRDDEAEVGEYSEFGPPVDMSTPSHFLRRTGAFAKEMTQLEDIEEDPDDEAQPVSTPSVQRQTATLQKDMTDSNEDLRRQIAELKAAIRERDQQLERNHRRVLEAASAGEQIKHLQAELQKKSSQLDDLQAKRDDEAILRQQIHSLQNENDEKELYMRRSSFGQSGLSALQKQLGDMQKELQSRDTRPDLDAERLETIAYLRQQLDLAQEQLKKRDATLEDTLVKLRDITATKELQLREKNTEIDGLKAQIDDNLIEIDRLETELDQANQEYRILEEKVESLETKNRPLEEKNSTLEADLNRAQSQVTAQGNALKAMAAEMPLEAGGRNTYTEILELIKDLDPHSTTRSSGKPSLSRDADSKDHEMEAYRRDLATARAELEEASSIRKALELDLKRSQEQAAEAQTLFKSIEDENTRLTKQIDDLRTSLDRVQGELNQMKAEHSEALETVSRLQTEKNTQQPSPPPSPPTPRNIGQTEKLEESYRAQLKSLQTAHATAISTLRSSHADSNRKLRDLLAAAEKRESKLKGELQSLLAARATQETQIQSLDAEVRRLQSAIAAKEEAAAALDERIARSVEKREKEWERRVDLLLKERERMAKALMWAWGEKEVGDVKENLGEDGRRVKQAYRYKYAQRKGTEG
jgi:chromosome segregation ATPase